MSIARIGEIQANADEIDNLRLFLTSIMPSIKSSPGCEACHLFQSQADPSRFIMLEVWEDVASHQASVKIIPPELLDQIRPLIAGSPAAGYFDLVAD